MGNQSSQPLSYDLDDSKFGHFFPSEIKEWFSSFKSIFPNGKISQKEFNVFFSSLFPFGNVEPFCSRLFQNINIGRSEEISFNELLISFTILLKGSTFEKIRWLFRFYDEDKDGFVSKEELKEGFKLINGLVSGSILTEINVSTFVDDLFEKLDNKSGFLTLQDFETLAIVNSENFKKISLCF